MNNQQSYLRLTEVPINDKVIVKIPTVNDILEYGNDCGSEYFNLVHYFVGTPYDYMVMLDDMGILYPDITEYQLFMMFFNMIKSRNIDVSIILKDIDFNNFELVLDNENGEMCFYDEKNDIVIDEMIYIEIGNVLRKILGLTKNNKQSGNKENTEYQIKKNRKKLKRALRENKPNLQLENSIIAMVNTSEFPYNYEETYNMSIYVFNKSCNQVLRSKEINYINNGIYAGTIDADKIDKRILSLISQD